MYQMTYGNLNVPRGEEEREHDCDNIMKKYGLFTEEVGASNKPLFAEFNPAVGRMDTLLRKSGNFVASYCFCNMVKALWRAAFQ